MDGMEFSLNGELRQELFCEEYVSLLRFSSLRSARLGDGVASAMPL